MRLGQLSASLDAPPNLPVGNDGKTSDIADLTVARDGGFRAVVILASLARRRMKLDSGEVSTLIGRVADSRDCGPNFAELGYLSNGIIDPKRACLE
jgi:hypothetical protein